MSLCVNFIPDCSNLENESGPSSFVLFLRMTGQMHAIERMRRDFVDEIMVRVEFFSFLFVAVSLCVGEINMRVRRSKEKGYFYLMVFK